MVSGQCLLSVGGAWSFTLRAWTLGSERPGSESRLNPFLVRLWACPVTSLDLSFLVCEMGTSLVLSSSGSV